MKTYPKRTDQVVFKELEGRGILLNLENGSYYETNPVGLAFWKECDGRKSSEAISRSVAREFETDVQQAARDLSRFAAQLKSRKLLELLPQPLTRKR